MVGVAEPVPAANGLTGPARLMASQGITSPQFGPRVWPTQMLPPLTRTLRSVTQRLANLGDPSCDRIAVGNVEHDVAISAIVGSPAGHLHVHAGVSKEVGDGGAHSTRAARGQCRASLQS